jgi:hypothetical protein
MAEFAKLEEITNDLEGYFDTSKQLLKLEVASNVSDVGSGMISAIIIGVVGFLFLLFLSVAGAILLSIYYGSNLFGFLIVAGFYLVLGIGLFFGRKKLFIQPFRDMITKNIFKRK